jgi:hypothetical protein
MPLSHQRVRTALFLALAALLAAAAGLHQHDAAASIEKATVVKQQPENLALKHSFSGKPPKGTWSVAAIPKLGQATDTTTPVVVSGLSSLFGKCAAQLKNRTFTKLRLARARRGVLQCRASPEVPSFTA